MRAHLVDYPVRSVVDIYYLEHGLRFGFSLGGFYAYLNQAEFFIVTFHNIYFRWVAYEFLKKKLPYNFKFQTIINLRLKYRFCKKKFTNIYFYSTVVNDDLKSRIKLFSLSSFSFDRSIETNDIGKCVHCWSIEV